jgi:hypothetical protein
MRFFARRLFLFGVVLAALAMLMTPALALGDDDDDDDGGGGGDRAFCAPAGPPEPAQCSFSIVAGTGRFDFDASSGPLGENPTGTFRLEVPTVIGLQFWEGEVTCLQVTGNRASIGGVVTNANPAGLVGLGFAISVLDNTPAADLLSDGAFLGLAPPANTPDCGDPSEPDSLVEGDIVVQDNIAGGGDDDDEDDDGDDEDDD